MSLEPKNVTVFMGGPGSEREVSLASGKAVIEALESLGHRVTPIDVVDTRPEIPAGSDIIFNVIHGTWGEDGGLQGYLDSISQPYTGAGAFSSEIAFDKIATKLELTKAGVPTPASEVIPADGKTQPSFAPPFVVKPPREGSSVGISIVKTEEEAVAAIQEASKYGDELLIEAFVEGKELTVGVLDNQALPIVHICPEDGWYDIKNKYPWMSGEGKTQYFCPADLDEETTKKVKAVALKAHQSVGVEVYSRVDVLLDADNNPYVLEINTIPGMTASSLLPKSAAATGLEFPQLCDKIINLSLETRLS